METVLRNLLILTLRYLIFLNQQLTRFFYDYYQGVQGSVQQFQKSHIVFDQLFYKNAQQQFAAQQQTSACRRHKSDSSYLKFSVEWNKITPTF